MKNTKISIRTKIITAILGLALVAVMVPSGTVQAALTESQIQSILGLLQAFGADTTTVANVEISLRGGTPNIPTTPSLTLTSPNGGEIWAAGENRNITWTSVGLATSNVRIDLYKGGNFVQTIVVNTPNNSTYTWTIPTGGISLGSDYKIRISKYADTSVYDESNSNFNIGAALASSITVISPNGGETFNFGLIGVNWTSTGITNANIYLQFPDGGTCFLKTVPASQSSTSVSIPNGYQCTNIPRTVTAGQYKIFIIGDTMDSVRDSSDNYFSIVAPTTPTSIAAPVLYMKFSDSADLGLDSSGNGNNATCSGTSCPISNASGKVGGAADFDGANDYLKLASGFTGPKTMTICSWIYPTGWGKNSRGRIFGSASDDKFFLRLDSSGEMIFTGNGSAMANSSSNSILLNTWQFVCASRDYSGTANLYINGVLSGNANQSSGAPTASSSILNIGDKNDNSRSFKGMMDEFQIYDQAFSASGIKSLYDSYPSITVTSPNGGDTWVQGSVQKITWITNNIPVSNTMSVRLRDDLGVEHYVYDQHGDTVAANYGSFDFTLSSTLTPGKYKAEVKTSVNNQSYLDSSDNYFTIVAPSTQPSITFTANGAENTLAVVEGAIPTFMWSTTNAVSCSSSGGTSNWAQSTRPTSGSVELLNPLQVSALYTITCVSSSGVSTSKSIQVNVSEATTPSITVTSPNGGEALTIGESYTLRWTSVGLDNALVNLYVISSDGTIQGTIANGVSNTGSYVWTIPQSQLEGAHRFYVSSGSISDHSNSVFSIWKKSITVTSPNGGEAWTLGTTQNITWTSNGLSTVVIYLSNYGDNREYILASSVPASSGSYIWTLPSNLILGGLPFSLGSQFKIKIGYGTIMDTSNNYFSIIAAETCTDSDGGKNYYVQGFVTDQYGTRTTDVCDNSYTQQNVYLGEYYCEGTEPTRETYACLYGCQNGACKPFITVTSPNGGETWITGTSHNITWTSGGSIITDPVNIYLYKGGVLLQTIATQTADTGTYAWTIPTTLIAGTDYKIRISKYGDAAIYDESNSNFGVVLNSIPYGYLDSVSSSVISGWAYDPNTPSSSIKVQLYANGSSGQGENLGQFDANVSRPDVNTVMGITGNHGFSVPLPDKFKTTGVTIYAYGVDAQTGGLAQLMQSPKVFAIATCTDSDGGIDYNTAGYTKTYSSSGSLIDTSYDTCFTSVYSGYPSSCYDSTGTRGNGTCLIEAYCQNGDGRNYDNIKVCPNGCENGACKPATTVLPVKTQSASVGGVIQGVINWIKGLFK